MNRKESYLKERHYLADSQKDKPLRFSSKVQYWEDMIGKEKVSALAEQDECVRLHLEEIPYIVDETEWKKDYSQYIGETEDAVQLLEGRKWLFSPFYCNFLQNGILEFCRRVEHVNIKISEQVEKDFVQYSLMRLQKVSLRVLILEMNQVRQELRGEDEKKEYEDFLIRFLGSQDYVRMIYERYPVLLRMMQEIMEQCVDYFCEIIGYLESDKAEIEKYLLGGNAIAELSGISCMSGDVHNNGRSVSYILLNEAYEIIYKPHSLKNEFLFQNILKRISGEIQLEQYSMRLISLEDHGWEEKIPFEECSTEAEAERFYERIGVQIFLAYCLGTSDLHCENMIAKGEFPVLIDLETLVSLPKHERKKREFPESVLLSGILPTYLQEYRGMGNDIGALNGRGGEKCRMKVAVIRNPYTSNMKVEYRQGVMKSAQNRVKIRGRLAEPVQYIRNIVQGFQKAYRCVQENIEVQTYILRQMKDCSCRQVISDTMKYLSLLESSYYPDLLEDGGDRELYVRAIGTIGIRKEKEITECEAEAMLQGDIPYFYNEGRHLMYAGRICVPDYFDCRPRKAVYERLVRLNHADERLQVQIMELSLAIAGKMGEGMLNSAGVQDAPQIYKKGYRLPDCDVIAVCENIAELIMESIYEDEEGMLRLLSIDLSEHSRTKIRRGNDYFYEGTAGVTVFLCALRKEKARLWRERNILNGNVPEMRWERAAERLLEQLKEYTGKQSVSVEHIFSDREESTRKTGMFDGEFSVVFAYLLLYEIEAEEEFLRFAELHAKKAMFDLQTDLCFDLIGGNAGAIIVLLKLYDITGSEEYLKAAEQAGELLCGQAVKQKQGVGWCVSGDVPLCGMAHGNSGILIALSRLYARTNERKFYDLCMKALEYEDTMYQEEKSDWKDLRKNAVQDNHTGGQEISWCHGAGGIALSRILVMEDFTGKTDKAAERMRKRLERDIQRALGKIKAMHNRKGMCVCHGTVGNNRILKKLRKYLDEDALSGAEADLYKRISGWKEKTVDVLPQEYHNPGFMSGLAGIGYYLLKEIDDNLPEVLDL